MMIPTGTDAPIYHRPVATFVMVAANIVMFWMGDCFTERPVPELTLQLGQGLHPLQWLSSNFIHYGYLHLIGNLIFLVAFGLVVEGKLGWWRFTLFYLATGCVGGLLIQLGHLSCDIPRSAAGASLAIYGLLAATLIWAPENEIEFVWIVSRYQPSFETQSATYLNFCGLFFLKELFCLWLSGWRVSSGLLHLLGAVIGGVMAVVLLRRGWVDCEGWDIFSLHQKRIELFDPPHGLRAAPLVDCRPQHVTQLKQELKMAVSAEDWSQVANLLIAATPDERATCTTLSTVERAGQWLYRQRRFSEAAELFEALIGGSAPEHTPALLKLAAISVEVEERPLAARRVLAAISQDDLSGPQQKHWRRIADKADRMVEAGVVELAAGHRIHH